MSREKPWHIAIVWDEHHSSLVIYDFSEGWELYDDAVKLQKMMDRQIVAEYNELSDGDMDRITGYTIFPTDNGILREENAVKLGSERLRDLVRRLNTCRGLNAQKELEKLCKEKA